MFTWPVVLRQRWELQRAQGGPPPEGALLQDWPVGAAPCEGSDAEGGVVKVGKLLSFARLAKAGRPPNNKRYRFLPSSPIGCLLCSLERSGQDGRPSSIEPKWGWKRFSAVTRRACSMACAARPLSLLSLLCVQLSRDRSRDQRSFVCEKSFGITPPCCPLLRS